MFERLSVHIPSGHYLFRQTWVIKQFCIKWITPLNGTSCFFKKFPFLRPVPEHRTAQQWSSLRNYKHIKLVYLTSLRLADFQSVNRTCRVSNNSNTTFFYSKLHLLKVLDHLFRTLSHTRYKINLSAPLWKAYWIQRESVKTGIPLPLR